MSVITSCITLYEIYNTPSNIRGDPGNEDGMTLMLVQESSSPVKMFLSSRQAGYSNRQQRQPRPEYKSDMCEVSSRYFVVGGQMAGCWHILTGLIKTLKMLGAVLVDCF